MAAKDKTDPVSHWAISSEKGSGYWNAVVAIAGKKCTNVFGDTAVERLVEAGCKISCGAKSIDIETEVVDVTV
ncbi:MAG: hypothetical protein KAX57_07195 [Rhodoferax sp.]|jgi:hypothetical protein|nr:hypothetical protein [Rhodoferax sp.]MBP9737438.1 hypothetical protein [Rhodoferax sp.]